MALNVALVGYGLAGQTFHAPLLRATPGLALTHVVSSNPDKVRADLPDVMVVPDIGQVLELPQIDLVVIATPDMLHAAQAIAAIEAGKHVVIDKPFAVTLDEARSVIACGERAGRLVSVFHNRRWDSDFLTLQRLIAEGALGEIVQFESHYDRFRPVAVDRWKERPGAGVWQDLGPHLVDQALRLFGMPQAVFADLARQKQGALTEDYCHVLLRYDRLRVILHASQMTPVSDLRFAVHGTGGSFIKYGLDPQEGQSKAGLAPGSGDWGVDPRPGLFTPAADSTAARAVEGERGNYQAYYAGIRDALRDGAPPPVTAAEAVDVMRVLAAGHRSHAELREIGIGE
jgi:predicted dehydrogenase